MGKREAADYRARIADDSGVVRGKIPSPLVREMGARPGDYMIFSLDSSGKCSVRVSRSKGKAKQEERAPRRRGSR
jgi:selenophosphate synthetase-related protein